MDAFKVQSVNLQMSTNKAEHHTLNYSSPELIVRRGQSFKITLAFDKELQCGESITFTAETGPFPSESNNTQAIFTLCSSQGSGSWTAVRESDQCGDMDVTICSPASAVIGCYKLNVQIIHNGKTSSLFLGQFVLLFNPWAPDDTVYMADEAERQEYVLNDNGILYHGLEEFIQERGWDFGQYIANILDICLTILDRSLNFQEDPAEDCSRRNDPAYVGRVVSAMVNGNNDDGVLVGTWGGQFSDGVDPKRWTGSVGILWRWQRGGYKPIRYGQCWVFGAVMCTVLRCLGIPNRVVTNFSSAHDTEGNLRIDKYYNSSGKTLNISNDTVWSYHVWNEAWFKRPDLGSFYDGWQVLDATPQELSEGIFRCGPTSVKAIKEGDVDLNYDGLFVFSEVNADRATWIYYDDEIKERVYSDTKSVGKTISTKAVGSDARMDITGEYKYPEGTDKEREVYKKACKKLFENETRRRNHSNDSVSQSDTQEEPDISGKFKLVYPPMIGHDIHIILSLKNLTVQSRAVNVNISSSTVLYTGQPMAEVLKYAKSVTLGPNREKKLPIEIRYSEYEKHSTKDNMIEVAALCEVEGGNKLLVRRDITLTSPPIIIKVLGKAVVDNAVDVEVMFTNPLSEDVTDCLLVVEGSGLLEGQLKKQLPPLKPKETSRVQFQITPSRTGIRQLLVDFTSKKFSELNGFQRIEVSEA